MSEQESEVVEPTVGLSFEQALASIGQKVLYLPTSAVVTVVKAASGGFLIEFDDGRQTWRSRQSLQALEPAKSDD